MKPFFKVVPWYRDRGLMDLSADADRSNMGVDSDNEYCLCQKSAGIPTVLLRPIVTSASAYCVVYESMFAI